MLRDILVTGGGGRGVGLISIFESSLVYLGVFVALHFSLEALWLIVA